MMNDRHSSKEEQSSCLSKKQKKLIDSEKFHRDRSGYWSSELCCNWRT